MKHYTRKQKCTPERLESSIICLVLNQWSNDTVIAWKGKIIKLKHYLLNNLIKYAYMSFKSYIGLYSKVVTYFFRNLCVALRTITPSWKGNKTMSHHV